MTYTPGQVLGENFIGEHWAKADKRAKAEYERLAAAVIAHVRPQIEAEARAAMVEQCATIAETPFTGEQDDITMQAKDRVAKAIRALAALPPTHQVVPVEPTEAMIEAARTHANDWSKALRPMQPLTPHMWRAACVERYKAMLAASKGEA